MWMVAPSEQALEQVIREDAIDILVELSGQDYVATALRVAADTPELAWSGV